MRFLDQSLNRARVGVGEVGDLVTVQLGEGASEPLFVVGDPVIGCSPQGVERLKVLQNKHIDKGKIRNK